MPRRVVANRKPSQIVYKLAPWFSRGAAAYAPVAFPGMITYAGDGMQGFDNVAPIQREFIFCTAAPNAYDHRTYALIEPGMEANRFASGTTRNRGLMPILQNITPSNDPGGSDDLYDLYSEVPSST